MIKLPYQRTNNAPLITIATFLLLLILGGCTMNDLNSNQEMLYFESDDFIIEGLKIPHSETAKKLTEKLEIEPGSVGLVMPMNYDLRLAIEKGLCSNDGFGKKYLYMQALYRKGFESWLLESTAVRDFNDNLANSELDFVSVPEKRQGFYQYYSTMDLQFVYLCSNIPIERLEKADLALLQSAIESEKADVTPEISDMIKRTFSDILMAYPNKDDNILCGYGYGSSISPNRSVVLEIRNYNLDENGDFRDFSNNAARSKYMKELALKMQTTLSEQLNHRVIVQVY